MFHKIGELVEAVISQARYVKIIAAIFTVITVFLLFSGSGNSEKISLSSDESPPKDTRTVQSSTCYVDVSGAVRDPGVYELPSGSRVFQAVDKAGGLKENADISGINQAEEIEDGMKLNIPTKGEASDMDGSSDPVKDDAEGSSTNAQDTRLIDINTADEALLQEIPGVGPVTAQKIIDHRKETGGFASIEELKEVSGIGDKTFEKMKSFIRV